MSKKKMLFKKFSIPEFVIYCVCASFVLWGLTYVILGLFAKYLPIPNAQNALFNADQALRKVFGLGFLGWGLILVGMFVAAAVVTMLVFAKNVDKEYERNQRRAARLNRNTFATPDPNIVDAEVKEE